MVGLHAEARSIISEGLAAAQASAAPECIDKCAAIAEWLGPRAARLGLTQFVSGAEVALQLMTPGFPLVRGLSGSRARMAEIGAGSGALGLGLAALCPTVEVTLLDRRTRAAGFIELCIRRFGLRNATAVCDDLREHRMTYDWVIARALAPGAALVSDLWALCGASGRIAVIGMGEARCAPAGLRRSEVLPTAIEQLRVDVYEADSPAG